MNWKNSNFQIFYHVLGNCHTAVEGLRVMRELKQDRLFAVKSSLAEAKRSESKVMAAKAVLDDKNETVAQKLISLANIEEQDARMEIAQPCFDAAKQELAFIEHLIEKLESKFGAASQLDFQRIQPVENALDLIVRAHTDLMLVGVPSSELLNEVRNSPYRAEVMRAVFKLRDLNNKLGQHGNHIEFAAMSKDDIFLESGIASVIDAELLSLRGITFPDLETLECKSVKQQALASPASS